MIHVFIILTTWLTILLFERLKFMSLFNQFLEIFIQAQKILHQPTEDKVVSQKLLLISLSQFRITFFLLLKLFLANIPFALFFLAFCALTNITMSDLINVYLLLECLIAATTLYFLRKYVKLKV